MKSPSKTTKKVIKPISTKVNLNQSTVQGQSRNQKGTMNAITGIQLTTPTSISMMNSFIIKNADTSFDQYYTTMKKRKQTHNQSNAFYQHNTSTGSIDNSYGKIRGKRPAARDGHTGILYGRCFIVFGGDRHHMPFNDSFILDLKAETMSKSFLFQ